MAESSLGLLFVRLEARPDLEEPDIQPVVEDLAAVALPRFPGMAGALAPEVVTFAADVVPRGARIAAQKPVPGRREDVGSSPGGVDSGEPPPILRV